MKDYGDNNNPTRILSYIDFAHRFKKLTPESVAKLFKEMPTAQTIVTELQCAEKEIKIKDGAIAIELPEAGSYLAYFDIESGVIVDLPEAIANAQAKIKSGEYIVIDVPTETQKFYDVSQLQISAVEFQGNFPKQESPIIMQEAAMTKEILLDAIKAGDISIAEDTTPKQHAALEMAFYNKDTNTIHIHAYMPEIEQISALVTAYSQAAIEQTCASDIGRGEKAFCTSVLSHILHDEIAIGEGNGRDAKTANNYSEALKSPEFSLDKALSRCEKAADFLSEKLSEIKNHHIKTAPAQSKEQNISQQVEESFFKDLT